MLEDNAKGIVEGRLLASTCRQMMTTAAMPDLWEGLAAVAEAAFQEHASGRDLVAMGNPYVKRGLEVVRVGAYIGASLHGRPDEAFTAQLVDMQWLFSVCPPKSLMYRRVLLPFIECFWTYMIQQCRFRFSNPSLVEEAMTQALRTSAEHRVKAILRAVSIGVKCLADVAPMGWLNGDE